MAIMSTVKIESTPKANSFPAKHIYTHTHKCQCVDVHVQVCSGHIAI